MSFSLFTITGASALAIITPMGLPKIKNQMTIKKGWQQITKDIKNVRQFYHYMSLNCRGTKICQLTL